MMVVAVVMVVAIVVVAMSVMHGGDGTDVGQW